jgi:hypothetical protein
MPSPRHLTAAVLAVAAASGAAGCVDDAPPARAHRARPRGVEQQRGDSRGHRLVVARSDEVAGLAFDDGLARAAHVGRDYGAAGRHVFEDGVREPFGRRTQHAHVRDGEQRADPRAAPREEDRVGDAELRSKLAQRRFQLALAREDEGGPGHLFVDAARGAQKGRVVFDGVAQVRHDGHQPPPLGLRGQPAGRQRLGA